MIDYKLFIEWLKKNYNPINIYFFGGITSKTAYLNKHSNATLRGYIEEKDKRNKFFKIIKKMGYKVRTKPVASLYDNTKGAYKQKCNFDVEMTIIAIDEIHDYEEMILCSGDGDFVKLVKYLKSKGKKTIILAHDDRLNWELAKSANQVIKLKDIKQIIQSSR